MNKLTGQTSPYLLQHANNPVHWHPWGEAALNLARKEDKPILLSIGYSACHWCHVMAHESFEDPVTAAVMNRLFINIKVDREERPDLDKIYQSAHSMLTNRPGGWPLTLFLTPDDQMPIFAGTYFPNQPRHGLPSFSQLLEQISEIYQTRKQDIDSQSHSIRQAYSQMAQMDKQHSADTLNAMPLDVARNQIEQQFDSQHGGFSVAPKFPHPAIIERALRHWARTCAKDAKPGDTRILHTAIYSLERMTSGGLFDHLGGGFCRYSTDEQWMLPHFEKMLYDNGPLLWLNVQAWCITHNPAYLDAATETADWVIREMQSPAGGYYSALDADSEGVEGKFYTWTPEQVAQILDNTIYPVFARRFGLDRAANFEGLWHLHGYASYTELAGEFNLDENTLRQTLREARERLFTIRQQRIHPGLDDKILTSWNGLMIQGMACAARLLQRDDYLDSAVRAASFIRKNLWARQRLMATCKDGRSHLNAYLDDYAFLLSGLLELLQTHWSSAWLEWAEEIADALIEQFEEAEYGGFFFTSHDHEQLIQRSKVYADEATPSGNGIAASALLDLGHLTGNTAYLDAAERCLKAAWQHIKQAAISHCSLLNALECYLFPPQIIVIRPGNKSLQQWRDYLGGRYMPGTRFYLIPDDANLPASLVDKAATGELNAYVCGGTRCQPPITDAQTLQSFIDNNSFSLKQN